MNVSSDDYTGEMVRQISGMAVHVEEADILGLMGAEREAAVIALSSGAEFPLVIIDGVLACHGSLDADAIAEVIRGKSA